jgi:YihY family inner membrane protein
MRTEMDFLLLRRIEQRLFAEDDALPGWRRRLLWPTRLLYVMLRDIFYGPLPLHATSLVYTTLLSLVPLMALGVAVIKLFGLPDQLLPLLHGFLQPLGERGETVNRTVIDFIERIDIAPLGSIGLILLVYVAVTLIYKVERSLNLIWRVRRHRTFLQLIGHCLLLVLLGPLLLVVLMGAIAVVMNSTLMHHLLALGAVSSLLLQLSWLLPVLLAALMIGAVYLLVPNTSVRLSAAFTGSTVASLLWQLCGRIFSRLFDLIGPLRGDLFGLRGADSAAVVAVLELADPAAWSRCRLLSAESGADEERAQRAVGRRQSDPSARPVDHASAGVQRAAEGGRDAGVTERAVADTDLECQRGGRPAGGRGSADTPGHRARSLPAGV